MAPQVQKVRTAFMFYQRDQLQKIRQELGANASMGDAMTEVRSRVCQQQLWRDGVCTSPAAEFSPHLIQHFMYSFLCFLLRRTLYIIAR